MSAFATNQPWPVNPDHNFVQQTYNLLAPSFEENARIAPGLFNMELLLDQVRETRDFASNSLNLINQLRSILQIPIDFIDLNIPIF